MKGAGAQTWLAAATAIITSIAILATVLLTALHSAIGQVQQVRDQLRAHPPATAQDVDRLKTQVGNQVAGIQQDVSQGLADAKKALKPGPTNISVTSPPAPPGKVVLVPTPGPTVTVRPTPAPAPTSKPPANCLLGLVGPDCPKKETR